MTLALIFTLLSVLVCLPTQALADDAQVSVSEDNAQLVDWSRLSGTVRYDTMQDIVQKGFSSAETVVIASGNSFADALSVTSLAGFYDAPVVLTETDNLSEQASEEITRLGAKRAIIAGGDGVITDDVFAQVEEIVGNGNVVRLSGSDRFGTVEKIYEEGKANNAWGKTAIVASGNNFADALSISSYAYAKNAPIFLTNNGTLDIKFVETIKNDGFDNVVIVGGTSPVSNETESALMDTDIKVKRLAGNTRYDTSIEIVNWCISNGLSYEGLGIAYGDNFPDALSGGAFSGSTSSVLLLVNDNNYKSVVDVLSKNASAIKRAYVFGGDGVISDNLYIKFQQATTDKSEDTDNLQAFAVYSQDDQSLNFYKRETVPSVGSTFSGKTATKVFTDIENMPGYSYSQEDGYQGIPEWCELYENVTTVTIVDSGIQPTNMDFWFGAFGSIIILPGTDSSDPPGAISESALESINNLDKIDTSKTTSMKYTFCYSQKLQTADIANWDVSKVENFTCCFYFTKFDSLDLSKWVTSSAKDMSFMFRSCGGTNGLDLNLSKFDTSKVQTMSGMFTFSGVKSITGIENWDTSNVENMCSMFSICNKLATLNLSNWNTSKVTDMSDMFLDCSSLTTLNLSSWNTSSVEVMRGMFDECSSLTSLNLSNWNTSGVTDMNNMFSNCSLLREVKGISDWNTSQVSYMGAMFYNCNVLTADCSKWNVQNVVEDINFNNNAPGVTAPNF